MGGAAGITMLLGMIRIKFAAVFIGSAGVGLMAGFTAIQGLIGTVAGLGIQSSAVRDIATAVGQGDEQAIGRAVLTLRRVCWLTGLAGMAVMMLFSPLLSRLTFSSDQYTLDIAALGIIILLANLAGGQLVLLQGMRRIGDMARANIIGTILATVSAIGFYYWLGLRGIVPSLVCIATLQLVIAWYFARRVPVPSVVLSWQEIFREANGMVKLGLAFMVSGLMTSVVSYITVTLITRQIDLHAVGIYSAAFALSGMFVSFVLGAMGADYYPRLTSLAHDKVAMNRLVNEQTEIGVLLALPGLLVTLTLAPWILKIFYTHEFLGAVELLQWFILGCLGRVISWPLGFVILALGKGRWFLLTEIGFSVVHVALIAIGLMLYGIEGIALAFAILYFLHVFAMNAVCKHLINFSWSSSSQSILIIACLVSLVCFSGAKFIDTDFSTPVLIVISIGVGFFSLRKIMALSMGNARFLQKLVRIPGVKILAGRYLI